MRTLVSSPTCSARLVYRLGVVLLAIGALAGSASAQTTVTLSTPGTHISVDTTIRDGAYASTNYSSSDTLVSKASGAGLKRRMLLKFDTENYIPANAVIQSARLYLVLKSADTSEQRPLTVRTASPAPSPRPTPAGTISVRGKRGRRRAAMSRAASARPGWAAAPARPTPSTSPAWCSARSTANSDRAGRGVELIDTGANSDGSYKAFHSTRAADASVRPRLVIVYGVAAAAAPAPPTPTGTTLRVMQWNIQNARGSDGICNPDRIANTIVAQNAAGRQPE